MNSGFNLLTLKLVVPLRNCNENPLQLTQVLIAQMIPPRIRETLGKQVGCNRNKKAADNRPDCGFATRFRT